MATAPEIIIESGVPIPDPKRSPGRSPKYPWTSMEVGDSFLVPEPSKYFASTVSHMGRLYNRKFIYRTEGNGIRVWRTA